MGFPNQLTRGVPKKKKKDKQKNKNKLGFFLNRLAPYICASNVDCAHTMATIIGGCEIFPWVTVDLSRAYLHPIMWIKKCLESSIHMDSWIAAWPRSWKRSLDNQRQEAQEKRHGDTLMWEKIMADNLIYYVNTAENIGTDKTSRNHPYWKTHLPLCRLTVSSLFS